MSRERQVKLTCDHSHVHPSLVEGAIGILGGNVGFDCNFSVYFPCAKTELLLFDKYFKYILTPEEQETFDQQIKTAYDVVHKTGPLGGYQVLTFKYTSPKPGTKDVYYREDGLEILQLFESQGTPVKVIKEPRKSKK